MVQFRFNILWLFIQIFKFFKFYIKILMFWLKLGYLKSHCFLKLLVFRELL